MMCWVRRVQTAKIAIHQGETERNRSRVVWGGKNDGWRCEVREMRGGEQADRREDREVW